MKAVVRTARKAHKCVMCARAIEPGERYYDYTTFPSDDLWLADHPTRFAECADCPAARAARRAAA